MAILDIRMPKLTGVEIVRQMRERAPNTKALMLTAYDDDEYVLALMDAGASGYLLKTTEADELVEAIRSVHSGEPVLDRVIASKVARLWGRRQQVTERKALDQLSPREREVLELAAKGLRNKAIADRLVISVRTRDPRFWAVQALVLLVALFHGAVESQGILQQESTAVEYGLSFVPVALYFIPVVYAALNFGLAGAIATASWCTLLTMPDLLLFHHGFQRLAELFQLSIVDGVAVFVGERVDREQHARHRAEASEAKYRDLFESSPAAVLVIGTTGVILEANPAAHVLFGKMPAGLRGVAVADLIGPHCAAKLLDASEHGERCEDCLVLTPEGGSEIYSAIPSANSQLRLSGDSGWRLSLYADTGWMWREAARERAERGIRG